MKPDMRGSRVLPDERQANEGRHLLEDIDDDNESEVNTLDIPHVNRRASHHTSSQTKTPGFVYFLTFVSAIGGFLFGYDTGVIAGAIVLLQFEFSLSSLWREAIVSIPMASAALFSLVSNSTNSRLGRKITILTASAVFTIGAILLAASQNVYMLLTGRFIIGIGIGLASSTVPMYIAECAPCHLRGRLVTVNNVFITGGQFIASIVSGAFSYDLHNGWRYMFGLAAIPPFLQFIGFMFMPESPRWLCDKKQHYKARDVLKRIRGTDDVEHELRDIEESCYQDEEKSSGCVLGRMLSSSPLRRALFIGCMLQLFQQIVGINTVMYYSATIIEMSGVGNTSSAIWLSSLTAAVNCLFTFVGFYVVDKVGRRRLTIISLIGVMFSLVFLGVGFQLVANNSPNVEIIEASFWSPIDHSLCANYTNCYSCTTDSACGFCYAVSSRRVASNGSCLPVGHSGPAGELTDYGRSEFGRCSNESRRELDGDYWAYDYCPTRYAWMTIVGLVLYLAFFAPGMGPMPWTINAEIYPLWARSTGNSIATCVNWISNLIISMTFLTLTESITTYGAFYLYAMFAVVGVVIFIVFLPETKGKQLEDIQRLFDEPFMFRRQRVSAVRVTQ